MVAQYKHKILLAASATALVVSCQAQTFVGLKSGVSFTKFDFQNAAFKRAACLSGGLFMEHSYGKSKIWGVELLFEPRRIENAYPITSPSGQILPGAKTYFGYNTISAPIYIGFKSTLKTFYISFNAGLIPAYISTAYTTVTGVSNSTDARYTYPYKKFDLAVMANMGTGITYKNIQIGVSGRFQYSVPRSTNAHLNSLTAFLSVGYKL